MVQFDGFDGRLLNYNDTIIYRAGVPAMENRDAPSQLRNGGPYRGKIADFKDEVIGVRADGLYGWAPLYYVWLVDILGVE